MKLKDNNPALSEHRTVFPYRVKTVTEVKKVLHSVANNSKLGNGVPVVAKGKWRGMAAFALTLEERKTCDPSCQMRQECYGNNMRFTTRVSNDDPAALMAKIEDEVRDLLRTYGKILVRPHILGDFFSLEYAAFWAGLVRQYPGLHLFGFTQWRRDSDLGRAIQAINDVDPERVWFRFSNAGGDMSANVEGEGIPCPEQIGKTDSCMTCGLCWSTTHPVSFKRH